METVASVKGQIVIPIAYGDCFATARGLLRQSPVITGDPEFKQVEDLVNVRWLSR